MSIIMDTGPLVAYIRRRDKYHHWARRVFAGLSQEIWCCEAVMSEAAFLLAPPSQGTARLLGIADQMQFPFAYHEEKELVNALMLKYRNVPMSFADACLVVMYEPGTKILTLDSDFLIYRTLDGQPLDVIMPETG